MLSGKNLTLYLIIRCTNTLHTPTYTYIHTHTHTTHNTSHGNKEGEERMQGRTDKSSELVELGDTVVTVIRAPPQFKCHADLKIFY